MAERQRRLWLLLGSLLILGLPAASCAPAATPPPTASAKAQAAPTVAASTPQPGVASATPKPAAEQPRRGGVLTRSTNEDAPHLDIHQAGFLNAQLPLANIYNGLVRFDPVDVNKVVPDLAERWDVSPDGKVYTFQLRKGVKWHDGSPFTSEDARFSLERMAFWKEYKIVSPKGGQALSAVDKVETVDDSSVRVTLKYPSASFLGNAGAGFVLMLPKSVIQARGDMKKDAVGTGPFKWKFWNLGISQEMERNADYFMPGLPYLDGIRIYVIKDDATRFAAFRTGQVKMTMVGSKALTHAQADMARKEMADKAVVVTHPTAMRFMLFMNLKRKPWEDLRVRQAVDFGFDRRAAIAINYNAGMLGAALHPKGAWGITEEEMAKRPGYRQPKDADVARAKGLLAEAGYADGLKTRMLAREGGGTEAQAVVVRDQLAKIGIDVTLEMKSLAAIEERALRHDFDLCNLNAGDPIDDPDATFSGFYITEGSKNYGEFSDPQIDELFKKQAAMMDQNERRKVVAEMQLKLLDLAIYPIVFWDVYNTAFWKEVRGYMPGFGPNTHNILDHVWLAR